MSQVPQISPLPPAPRRSDAPEDFSAKADALAAAQPGFVAQANTLVEFANQRSTLAEQAANSASDSSAAAAASAQAASSSASLAEGSADTAVAKAAEAAESASSADSSAQAASASAQNAAADAQAVADGLASIAGGPVASVAGKTGVVALEQLAEVGVATQSGAETLTNKTLSGPRSSMAQYIDKTVTNAAATGTVTLDLSQADVFNLTLSGNTTLAISNAPALSGETFAIVVRVSQGATAFALTWFSGITWLTSGGTAPAAPAANKSVEYVLSTMDGTNWIGRKGAAN